MWNEVNSSLVCISCGTCLQTFRADWVIAADSVSSCTVKQAVKGHDWHKVLQFAPQHATHPPLPGLFVFQRHTRAHTPSAVVIQGLHAREAHSLLSPFAFPYSSLFHSLAVFYLEGKSQAFQNFCLYYPLRHMHTLILCVCVFLFNIFFFIICNDCFYINYYCIYIYLFYELDSLAEKEAIKTCQM